MARDNSPLKKGNFVDRRIWKNYGTYFFYFYAIAGGEIHKQKLRQH